MAKNLLVWPIFKATGCVKVCIWHQQVFELKGLSLQWRNKNLGANTQWPSLAHSHNRRGRVNPHRGGCELDPEGKLCWSKRPGKVLLAEGAAKAKAKAQTR